AVKVDSVVTMDLETSSAAQGFLSLPELSDSPQAVKVDSVVTMDLETSSAAQGSLSLPELSDSPQAVKVDSVVTMDLETSSAAQGSLSLPELSDSPQDTWSSWIWNLVSLTQKEQVALRKGPGRIPGLDDSKWDRLARLQWTSAATPLEVLPTFS
ncbi:unnamed protein product, partial [Effrenium voratum]